MLALFLQASFIIFISVTLLWILSIFLKNVSIIDLFWGFAFVLLANFYTLLSEEFSGRKLLLVILVSIWGLRLSIYLALRNIGKDEDFRYQKFRQNYGADRYWWLSYFQVFLLQGVLIMIVSLPILGVNENTNSNNFSFIDYLGIFLWLIGFAFEAGGDYQLARFKTNPENKGKVLTTGFWKYTRHPNYFGDCAIWWSYALFSIAAGSYWHIIGSFVMTLLIIKVSGVALLEKSLRQSRPDYQKYIDKTSSFFPWFPKK